MKLTKKQQNAKRKAQQLEASMRRKLERELAPKTNGRLKLNLPNLTYDKGPLYESERRVPARVVEIEFEPSDAEEREREAQVEIARKKKRVAPLYNKGGYQYLGDDVDPTTIGKKI